MKVLHMPSGSDISMLAKQMRALGVDATSASFSSKDLYGYRADRNLNVDQFPPEEKKAKIEQIFQEAMNEFDVFHFHFGKTFNSKSDIAILKSKGKKMVAHHRGSEVRLLSLAQKNNRFASIKSKWPEETVHKYVRRLSASIDHAIVPDYEMLPYVEPYYKHVHVVLRAIDVSSYTPVYPKETDKPVVVHAPSHHEIKGTPFVLEAVEQLKQEGLDFEFRKIENLSHEEAMKAYQKATVVIDQLRIGSYANLTMESMALGKPVICYVREDLVSKFPGKLPIINANPDTLTSVLRNFLMKNNDWNKIGKESRAYVEQYHHVERIAKQMIDIYKLL
ncbi:glycosyltransferase family 4 protein [Geomicrobium sediminis]|uniref:Glycosyltransferase involved in cell wall biosynthesis n=1 Tax=Geomicrobium sediminis TaxID=1347788 RepID=A0ABS2P817_9BACL|nr:glycosyltransferase family 4 protein [Geomicrobium sediminis]MBM7631564.1 glycosyltransferase involved in cell wall biosynthesis [Geomicrobium sediminis]